MILYPSGDSKSNGTGYISLYLAIAETENYEEAWSVSTHFKLFAYDYQADAFIVFEGTYVYPTDLYMLIYFVKLYIY